ncbi:MAG: hypothetical protein E7271_00335 [Lachnospiraceae bacterium]|nr:hypothetical protein [Lachnospiraceae bacterium]
MDMEEQFKQKYIHVRVPDKAMLAMYIKEAKGTDRNMAEFAKCCGTLTPSSFSRIIHGNLSKPLTAEVIQSIVRNADPKAKLSYMDMMYANGMVPENDNGESETGRERRIFSAKTKDTEIKVRNIIVGRLFELGNMLLAMEKFGQGELNITEKVSGLKQVKKSNRGFGIPGRFTLRIQGIDPFYYNYEIFVPDPECGKAINTSRFRDYEGFFLRDMWESDTLEDIMQNFVFTEREYYDAFWEFLKGVKVNNYMAAILVDTEQESVVEYMQIPRVDGKKIKSIY